MHVLVQNLCSLHTCCLCGHGSAAYIWRSLLGRYRDREAPCLCHQCFPPSKGCIHPVPQLEEPRSGFWYHARVYQRPLFQITPPGPVCTRVVGINWRKRPCFSAANLHQCSKLKLHVLHELGRQTSIKMNPDPTTVKRTLRALLLSSKLGCTPKQLLNDYHHIVGESLPFEALGYRTFMKYIQSIPDVVHISNQQDRIVLFGVADGSTQHIAKMVAKQKTPLRRRYSSMLNVSSTAQVRRAQVPHPFKLQMKTLMLSYPNGLLVDQFMEAFARRFGYYVNCRAWGYPSLDLMLKAIPDVVMYEMDVAQKRAVIKRVSGSTVSRPPDAIRRSRAPVEGVASHLPGATGSKPQGSEMTKQNGICGEGTGWSGEKPPEKVKSKPPGINSKQVHCCCYDSAAVELNAAAAEL